MMPTKQAHRQLIQPCLQRRQARQAGRMPPHLNLRPVVNRLACCRQAAAALTKHVPWQKPACQTWQNKHNNLQAWEAGVTEENKGGGKEWALLLPRLLAKLRKASRRHGGGWDRREVRAETTLCMYVKKKKISSAISVPVISCPPNCLSAVSLFSLSGRREENNLLFTFTA